MSKHLLPGNTDKLECSGLALRSIYTLLIVSVFFLPFTKALTYDVGFPLKIYEILFTIVFVTLVFSCQGYKYIRPGSLLLSILAFCLVAALLTVINVYLLQDVPTFNYRGGIWLDSMSRIMYLVFNICVLCSIYWAATGKLTELVNAWFYGMTLSVIYSLYCVISTLLGSEPHLLPGLDHIQYISIRDLKIPRSGTFLEGNFAGLYFLSGIALALIYRKRIFMLVAFSGLVMTQATSALAGLFVFVSLLMFFKYGKQNKLFLFITIISLLICALLWAGYFDVANKFDLNNRGSSVVTRVNETVTGWLMFLDNPFMGIGLGQYGYRFEGFEWYSGQCLVDPVKRIPNNVYIEVMAETGVFGLFFFLLFWLQWLLSFDRLTRNGRISLSFGMSMFLIWLAYPTFQITFIWCIAGLLLAINARKENHGTSNLIQPQEPCLQYELKSPQK